MHNSCAVDTVVVPTAREPLTSEKCRHYSTSVARIPAATPTPPSLPRLNGYEQARLDAVWNARKPDRYPDLIVIAEHESDVVKAVGLAKADCGSASAPVGTAGWETGSATVDC